MCRLDGSNRTVRPKSLIEIADEDSDLPDAIDDERFRDPPPPGLRFHSRLHLQLVPQGMVN
jgi:hypothetical protein